MILNRYIALFLALLMIFSMLPPSAFAEEVGASAEQKFQVSTQETSGSTFYNVTFLGSDGNVVNQFLVRSGSSLVLPDAEAVSDPNVIFDGWATGDNYIVGKTGGNFTPLSDVTLQPHYSVTQMTKSIVSESNLGHVEFTAPTGFLGLGQGGLPSGADAEANWAAVDSYEAAALAAVPAGEGMTNRAIAAFMLSVSNEYWQQNSSVRVDIAFSRAMELKENETLTLVRVSDEPQVIPCSFSGNPLSGAAFSDSALGTYIIVGTSAAEAEPAEEENVFVTETDIVLRAKASGLSEVVATVPAGTQITLVSEEGDWTLVKLLNGTEGYVYSKDLEEAPLSDGEMKITIFSDRRPIMEVGEPVTIFSRLEGFDGYELYYIWEVDKGNGFEEIPDSNYPTYSFPASSESLSWDWRLEVLYR